MARYYLRTTQQVSARVPEHLSSSPPCLRGRVPAGGYYVSMRWIAAQTLLFATLLVGCRAGSGQSTPSPESVFALGLAAQEGQAPELDPLIVALHDARPEIRALAVGSLSRYADAQCYKAVVTALHDPEPIVQQAAAIAVGRMDLRVVGSEASIEDFLQFTQGMGPVSAVTDAELLWRVLFAVARLKLVAHHPELRAVCLEACNYPDQRVRIFALQGLRDSAHDEHSRAQLRSALQDPDPRVAQEAALTLQANPDLALLSLLRAQVRADSTNLQVCTLGALGSLGQAAKQYPVYQSVLDTLLSVFEETRLSSSYNVRAAALEALSAGWADAAAPYVVVAQQDPSPIVRAGAARAARHLSCGHGLPILLQLANDADLRVSTTAVEGLATWEEPVAREAAVRFLEHSDPGMRLMAMGVLVKTGTAEDLAAVQAAIRDEDGGIVAELAQLAVDVAVRFPQAPKAQQILRKLVNHRSPFVGRKAAKALQQQYGVTVVPAGPQAEVMRTDANQPLPSGARITTERGTLELELYGAETPQHVRNFAVLAQRGIYEGLQLHRVVPNFVVQGGDPRGDGNGGITWDGKTLKAEFTPRPFVEGSLGMPRNDDPDSGGCQVFFTLRETPHLDGRYTNFGTVTKGLEVLQRIEVGDRIVKVELLP